MLILVVIAQLRHPRNNIINIINIPNINNIRLKLRNIHKHIDFKHGTAPTAEISPRSLHFGRVNINNIININDIITRLP